LVQAGSSIPFTGSWWSIDPVDGSTQHLDVTGGGTHVAVRYVDEFATTCSEIGAPTNVFTGRLSGTANAETMTARFNQARCGPVLVLKAPFNFSWTFTYDAGTDTLFGAINDGPAIWYRN
jgi:hypothetical protein